MRINVNELPTLFQHRYMAVLKAKVIKLVEGMFLPRDNEYVKQNAPSVLGQSSHGGMFLHL